MRFMSGAALLFSLVLVACLAGGCSEDEGLTTPNITVAVNPATAVVAVGSTRQFTAIVGGTANTAVTWAVDGGTANGTVSAGLYTAPASAPNPAMVTVRVTSVADATKSGTAMVTVTDIPELPGFVAVPAGAFTMGDSTMGSASGNEERDVTLTHSFYLGQYEVTNETFVSLLQWAYEQEYVAVMGVEVFDRLDGNGVRLLVLGDISQEIMFDAGQFGLRDAGNGLNPDHPVKEITWFAAAAYCDWLSLTQGLPRAYDHSTWQCGNGDPYGVEGYRLPTEAEWEYAAQYDDERPYPWGDEQPDCSRGNVWPSCVGWTAPVGSYPATPIIGSEGFYDLAGNVQEWCNDWFAWSLGTDPQVDPVGPVSGTWRVVKGGPWWTSNEPRCAYHDGMDPDGGANYTGFRVARSVQP